MQILTFTVAGQPYAVESRSVLEVLPLVPLRPIPLMPDYCPGVFTYRGRLVPAVDLGRRFGVTPSGASGRKLSTRVIVVEFVPDAPTGGRVAVGLVAENVVSIGSAEEVPPASLPMELGHAPFLGRLLRQGGTTVQLLVIERILPPDLLAGLKQDAAGVPSP